MTIIIFIINKLNHSYFILKNNINTKLLNTILYVDYDTFSSPVIHLIYTYMLQKEKNYLG